MKIKSSWFLIALLAIAAVCVFLAPRETLTVLAPLSVVALAIVGVANSNRSLRRRGLVPAVNVAEGTHAGTLTKKTDAAIATRNLLVKFGSDANHIAACGASDIPLGVCDDEASAAETDINVELLGISKRTLLMVANEAITAGEAVYTAASGKVQDLPAGAGTYYKVGHALTAAGADGDVIEVQHCAPIATVVS